MSQGKKKSRAGRKTERLKAEGVDWKDALRYALKKPKPGEKWPER